LQLHGTESPDRVAALKARFGLPVMKVLPVGSAADLGAVAAYAGIADRVLFDARPPQDASRPGGLGQPFDWRLLTSLPPALPFMLSGGLHAGNVAEAIQVARPLGVDVSSGVERTPGQKAPALIRDFIRAAREAASREPEQAPLQRSPAESVAS
jgi:phosphoribosylanthranilate isomerase